MGQRISVGVVLYMRQQVIYCGGVLGQSGLKRSTPKAFANSSPAVGAAATTLVTEKISVVTLKGFVPPERFQRFLNLPYRPGLKQPLGWN